VEGDEVGELVDVQPSDEDRGERRRLHAGLATCVVLALAAARAGCKTTGIVRVLLAVAAGLLAALSAWIGLFAFAFALLDRLAGAGRPRSPRRSGST
jgi:hypothetical protein